MDRRTWQATVRGVAETDITEQLSFTFHTPTTHIILHMIYSYFI